MLLRSLAVLALLLTVACASLPDAGPTPDEFAGPAAAQGPLAQLAQEIGASLAPEESGLYLLPAARDALAWRLALIDSARVSIEAQYFVWHSDEVGTLLIERLFAAADRGVKVRLLVDDLHLVSEQAFSGNDQALAAVDAHPNFELRLFNPGRYRSGTAGVLASLGTDSRRYNRRMHNKALLADSLFAIVGGRNVGNEYFGLDHEFNFVDLDLLVTAAVLPEVSAAFDQYWNSELVYPAASLSEVSPEQYREMRRENQEYLDEHSQRLQGFQGQDHAAMLSALAPEMKKGMATFLRDEPTERGGEETRLFDDLGSYVPPGTSRVLVSTPYLIPTGPFFEYIGEDIAAGATVSILTNSLATNNQPAVHSHYKKYRGAILDEGAALFELHAQPAGGLRQWLDTPPVRSGFAALHMKASVADRERCLIGTLNLDPRSIHINTEDLMYLRSPGLCAELDRYLAGFMAPEGAWQVTRGENGALQWTSHEGTVTRQPARNTSQRLMDSIYRLLPESQL